MLSIPLLEILIFLPACVSSEHNKHCYWAIYSIYVYDIYVGCFLEISITE